MKLGIRMFITVFILSLFSCQNETKDKNHYEGNWVLHNYQNNKKDKISKVDYIVAYEGEREISLQYALSTKKKKVGVLAFKATKKSIPKENKALDEYTSDFKAAILKDSTLMIIRDNVARYYLMYKVKNKDTIEGRFTFNEGETRYFVRNR